MCSLCDWMAEVVSCCCCTGQHPTEAEREIPKRATPTKASPTAGIATTGHSRTTPSPTIHRTALMAMPPVPPAAVAKPGHSRTGSGDAPTVPGSSPVAALSMMYLRSTSNKRCVCKLSQGVASLALVESVRLEMVTRLVSSRFWLTACFQPLAAQFSHNLYTFMMFLLVVLLICCR